MKKIRYFDMFAGAGGFRSGLANTGDFFMPVGWCEIDKYAQRAYRALYETDGEYFCEDARAIRTDELPEIDLICAGFPCQPFSVSGRRLGFADTRGTLFHDNRRISTRAKCKWHEARRPSYLLLENVPGLLNHENGQTFGTILAAIHELGYSLEWLYAVLRKRNTTARISESRSSEGGGIIVALRETKCDIYDSRLLHEQVRAKNISCPPEQWNASCPACTRRTGAALSTRVAYSNSNRRSKHMFDKSRWRLGSENPTLEKWNFSKSTLLRRFEPKPYRYTRSAMYHNKAGRGYKPSERRAFRRARHRRKGRSQSRKR